MRLSHFKLREARRTIQKRARSPVARRIAHRLIGPAIRRHYGSLVQTAGNSLLITFDSITEAVRCAVTIQHALAKENDGWPDDRRMWLRVGVDLGDVITDGRDFHGDGVIVAVRLQEVCPPGASASLARCTSTAATGLVCHSKLLVRSHLRTSRTLWRPLSCDHRTMSGRRRYDWLSSRSPQVLAPAETDDEGQGTMEGNMATDDNHSCGTMSHGFTLEPTDSAAQDSQSAGHV